MRNSFSFDLKILIEVDILIKVGMSFQSLTLRDRAETAKSDVIEQSDMRKFFDR